MYSIFLFIRWLSFTLVFTFSYFMNYVINKILFSLIIIIKIELFIYFLYNKYHNNPFGKTVSLDFDKE